MPGTIAFEKTIVRLNLNECVKIRTFKRMLAGGTRQNVIFYYETRRSKRRVFGEAGDAGKLLITIKRHRKIVKYKFMRIRGIVSNLRRAATMCAITVIVCSQ